MLLIESSIVYRTNIIKLLGDLSQILVNCCIILNGKELSLIIFLEERTMVQILLGLLGVLLVYYLFYFIRDLIADVAIGAAEIGLFLV